MADDVLRDFARTLAAKVALAKAAPTTRPRRAVRDRRACCTRPSATRLGWLERNRHRPPAGQAERPSRADAGRHLARARADRSGAGADARGWAIRPGQAQLRVLLAVLGKRVEAAPDLASDDARTVVTLSRRPVALTC